MGSMFATKEEVEQCIRQLESIKSGNDPEYVLTDIRPTILKLSNGKALLSMVEKLVRAGNADRAIKLIRVASKSGTGPRRLLKFVMPVLGGAALLFVMPLMTRCNGAYEPAMAALNNCPQATALLGAPIKQSPVGLACGQSESSGSFGHAQWSFSVSGPMDSGRFKYAGRNDGNGWRVLAASLDVGDQTVSIFPCSGGGVTTALTSAVTYTGTVAAAGTGLTNAPAGTPCSITVSPTPPEAVASGYNCHVRVQCGNAILYGWEGAGYTRCQIAGGSVTRADDTTGAAAGDDPKLALDLLNRTCTVSDDGATPYSLVISLPPAAAEAVPQPTVQIPGQSPMQAPGQLPPQPAVPQPVAPQPVAPQL